MSSRIAMFVRGAVSLCALAIVLSRTPLEGIAVRVAAVAPVPFVGALLFFLAMPFMVAVRWRWLMKWLGFAVPLGPVAHAVLAGLFGGQLLPSLLGTDVLRAAAVARQAGTVSKVVASVLVDRLVALFAACLLIVLAFPFVARLRVAGVELIALLAALLSTALLVAYVALRIGGLRIGPLRDSVLGESVALNGRYALAAAGMALVIHSFAVGAAALVAAAYGIDAPLGVWLGIVPASIVAAALPISINGWGIRETVIVGLAAAYGVARDEALLVSLTLGVLNLIASLPGVYALVRWPARDRPGRRSGR
jgi:uncharacterized membrane protein YbhN (UPF0104 family)